MATVSTTELHVGDDAIITAIFRVGGTATNPSDARFIVRGPDATETTYTLGTDAAVGNPNPGTVTLTLPLTAGGPHQVQAIGTGTAKGASPSVRFYVEAF